MNPHNIPTTPSVPIAPHRPELAPFELPLYGHHAFPALVQLLAAVVYGGLQ
jgi:hypothetical protein